MFSHTSAPSPCLASAMQLDSPYEIAHAVHGMPVRERGEVYTAQKPTPQQWRDIWLRKLVRSFDDNDVCMENRGPIRLAVEQYLTNNPYSPYYIHEHRLVQFLEKGDDTAREALRYFYTYVAPSEKHVQCIVSFASHVPALGTDHGVPGSDTQRTDADESEKLLQQLRDEVRVRDLSRNTLKNYCGAVGRFLDRLTPVSANNWPHTFKEHLLWLRDEQKLAPSTINQHAAAIKFFLEEVLRVKPGDGILVRMKTGKPLPRVHSRERIKQILTAPYNPKHRTMLMFAYGCGLRLGEIQQLRPEHIDLDRKVVWVRKGKGKKDRIIMLDQDMVPAVETWLKTGCGEKFLFEGYRPGKAISRRTIEKVYTNTCAKLGIDHQGGIHSLRHSFATHLPEQGVDLRYIQELLGHASSRTTEVYTHVAAQKIAEIRSPIAGLLS